MKVNKQNISDSWRNLGFFYEVNDVEKRWHFVGSKEGLFQFYNILINYVKDSQYDYLSAHEHYGPYMYLEIMTWNEAGIDGHSIHGKKEDIKRLAEMFLSRLKDTPEGYSFTIGEDYALNCNYSILIDVKKRGYDPAETEQIGDKWK